jgi:DNA-binding PadR family transcriptional regulator
MAVPTQKLSRQQKAVLILLSHEYQMPENQWRPIEFWGVDWGTMLPRSQQASVSRTLRHLEARGLVKRHNDISGKRRTTCVQLTPQGRAIAETVNNQEGQELLTVSRLFFRDRPRSRTMRRALYVPWRPAP